MGFENALCENVPVFARFRESGKTQAGPSALYRVEHFNHGLVVPGLGSVGRIDTLHKVTPLDALPAPLPPDTGAAPLLSRLALPPSRLLATFDRIWDTLARLYPRFVA